MEKPIKLKRAFIPRTAVETILKKHDKEAIFGTPLEGRPEEVLDFLSELIGQLDNYRKEIKTVIAEQSEVLAIWREAGGNGSIEQNIFTFEFSDFYHNILESDNPTEAEIQFLATTRATADKLRTKYIMQSCNAMNPSAMDLEVMINEISEFLAKHKSNK